MTTRRARRGSATRRLLAGTAIGAGAIAVTSGPASAATTATFNTGVLTVIGDSTANDIQISRDAAGRILVNDGGVTVAGGTPTVANTSQIRVFGLAGNDVLTLNETNGALPAAHLFGGADNDALTGGAGADELFGQAGNDSLLGRGSNDLLFGGGEIDTLVGGDADDQSFGQGGDDLMIWNPGDDTDTQRRRGRHRRRSSQRRQRRRAVHRYAERFARPVRPSQPGTLRHRHRDVRDAGRHRQRRRRHLLRLRQPVGTHRGHGRRRCGRRHDPRQQRSRRPARGRRQRLHRRQPGRRHRLPRSWR